MRIQWTDERSVLRDGKDVYQAGDFIPADLLSKNIGIATEAISENFIKFIDMYDNRDKSNIIFIIHIR